MSEAWRVKHYYHTRILIGTDAVLDPEYPDARMLCLTGGEMALLKQLLGYAHRRSSFVSEYFQSHYLAPSTEEWDAIDALVAELEHKMTTCEDFLAALEAIATQQGLANDQLSAMQAELACICANMPDLADGAALGPIIDEYLEDESLSVDDPYPGGATPGEESDACAIAQLVWQFSYEMLTEVIQPIQTGALSVLLPAAILAITGWLSGLVLTIPVGAIMYYLREVIAAWARGSLDGVVNTWYTLREELVCAAYLELAAESTYGAASSAMYAVIDEQPDLSPIDKLVFKAFTAPWVFGKMAAAWDVPTAWASARVTPGYCAACTEAMVGSNWVAVPWPFEGMPIEFDHGGGSWWEVHCGTGTIPAGFRLTGLFYEIVDFTGTCTQLKKMAGSESCAVGSGAFNNTSEYTTVNGWYFTYVSGEFNNAECLATVYPTATPSTQGAVARNGPLTVNWTWNLGYTCTGSCKIYIRYLVFNGTTIPTW